MGEQIQPKGSWDCLNQLKRRRAAGQPHVVPLRVSKFPRSRRKMNIWWNCSSSCRCVVFIQPLLPPRHRQHLHPARSPQQELGRRQAANASVALIFFTPVFLRNSCAGSSLNPLPRLTVAGGTPGVLALRARRYRSAGTGTRSPCQVLMA